MRNRMDVVDRAERDPAFKALVDLLTAWLINHPDYTPSELREAAMMAASDVEWMVWLVSSPYYGIDARLDAARSSSNGL